MKNLWKNNDLGSPGQLQIDPRWPQARSRWPKIDPRRLQDGLEECFCRCSKSSSIWRRLGVVLGSILAPFGLPKCVPFGTLLASQIDQKSKSIFKSEKIPFKTVLGPSWSRLGPILGHLDRAWGDLGAIWGRLGEPKALIFLRLFNVF